VRTIKGGDLHGLWRATAGRIERVLVRATVAGVTPDHTIQSVDTLGPRRRGCSATRAPASARMAATPVSRSAQCCSELK
jgi:hypothetical protein